MPHKHALFEPLNTALFALLIFLAGELLNINYLMILIAALGSLVGACALAYFKREGTRAEIILKIALGTLCGIVTGAVSARYLEIEHTEYLLANYAGAGMLSLFFIKGLISVTETNTEGWLTRLAEYFLRARMGDTSIIHKTEDGNNSQPKISEDPDTG